MPFLLADIPGPSRCRELCREICTGEVAWQDKTDALIDGLVRRGKRPVADEPITNHGLRLLIEQSWHTDPKQRPTASQIIHAIKQIMKESGLNPLMSAASTRTTGG